MSRLLMLLISLLLFSFFARSVPADTLTVSQVGITFSPANITINQGDTIRWVWATGIHTVTSGGGGAVPTAGDLFDFPLNSAFPQTFFTFSASQGVFPYFCRPHESLGMKGTVNVEVVTGVPEPAALEGTTWARLKLLFVE